MAQRAKRKEQEKILGVIDGFYHPPRSIICSWHFDREEILGTSPQVPDEPAKALVVIISVKDLAVVHLFSLLQCIPGQLLEGLDPVPAEAAARRTGSFS